MSFLSILLQSITKFESLANQVQKNAGDIEERLHMIENTRLFKQPPPKPGCDLMEAKVHTHTIYMYMYNIHVQVHVYTCIYMYMHIRVNCIYICTSTYIHVKINAKQYSKHSANFQGKVLSVTCQSL